MIPRREVSDAMICCISIDEMFEVTEGNKVQQLREHRATTIHDVASFARKTGKDKAKSPLAISNRRNPRSRQNSRHYWVSTK
jgi:hypothetical protein